jgi:hypothetical protein
VPRAGAGPARVACFRPRGAVKMVRHSRARGNRRWAVRRADGGGSGRSENFALRGFSEVRIAPVLCTATFSNVQDREATWLSVHKKPIRPP